MSSVSPGRKGQKNKKPTRRLVLPDMFGVPDECDCPSCSGADFDPRQLIDELTASAADLIGSADPLDAEMMGAAFASISTRAGAGFEEVLVGGFIPEFEARATTEALAMLLAIGSVGDDRAGKAAGAAVDRLVEAGVARPGWAAELSEPVTVADCRRVSDSQGVASMLACSFHRAGRRHAVLISVDHLDCGAASGVFVVEADLVPEALEMMRVSGRHGGFELTEEALDADEFRWQVEQALDARAVHDSDDARLGLDDLPGDEDGPADYPVLEVFVRARTNSLPVSGKPRAPHGDGGDRGLSTLAQLADRAGAPFGAGMPVAPRRRTAVAALPAKRTRSDRRSPLYQIKVGLRGAKPPIWRRLEVPADISLAGLHAVIQLAFDWDDGHLHVFETPSGNFGIADADLGHRSESAVRLEQVAPQVGSTMRYTYDFGDDWDHDILVEKILDRSDTAGYPRCTGGRRAAPPEDCGGIWGYANLVEILNDPAHPEHQDRLEWLGLADVADFDPDKFEANAVTQTLSRLR